MEYYFETDDKLDRKRYAEFLKSMLENCDKYRREDSDGAYVIAIDSPWGTGKTRFAKMLRNYLEDRTKGMGDKSLPGRNASFNAIYYNSWETDFSDDALLPLVHSILESPEMEVRRFDNEGKITLEKFKKVAIDVAKIAGYTILHNVFGETVTQMAKAAEAAASEPESDPLKSYKDRLDVLNNFKSDMQDVIAQTRQKKLVIIIDELDRCRPTFAIQTLELAKHLFSVKGLIFVFALDIKQLSSSVKTVYGQEMDAAGYLCRFFDYIGRIPNPNLAEFIKERLMRYEYYNSYPSHYIDHNVQYIRVLAETFKFSLRDIVTFLQSYGAMIECFLGNYDIYSKHHLYLFLLALKYKDSDLYNRLFKVSSWLPNKKMGESEKYNLVSNSDYNQYLADLQNEKPLRNAQFRIVSNDIYNNLNARVLDVTETTSGQVVVRLKVDPNGVIYEYDTASDTQISWGNVLFKEDFCIWGQIKEHTLSEYLFSQLEMFNFALPADEPEPNA